MIAVNELTKTYRRASVLDHVSFSVAPGSISGFLGPNGAGKSTTLRILTGLSRPTSGSALVGGRPYAALPNPAHQVGTLLDAGALHPGRTGHETLLLGAIMLGLPQSRADTMIDYVGLSRSESRRRVRTYSLGMRQRLGIGLALLGRPRVLILDEPANGLDPQGIRWLRAVLADQAAAGCAVLLSSHLLHEIEQICNEIIMIAGGRIVADGSVADFQTSSGPGSLEQTFLWLTTDSDRSAA